MAILILPLANYLLDIVSPGEPTIFGAGGKMLGFGLSRWPENAFPSLAPWTYQCAKAPHFLYYVPRNINSPASSKKPFLLPVQLPLQISVTSNGLKSRFGLKSSFLFRMATQGVMGHLIKTWKERLFRSFWMVDKKRKRILRENAIFIGQALAITKKLYDEQK